MAISVTDGAVHTIWRTVLRALLLVQLGLLLASTGVSLLGYNDDPSADEDTTRAGVEKLSLFRAVGYYSGHDARRLGSTTAHPYALSGGRTVRLVGLIALLLLLVGALGLLIVLARETVGRAALVVSVLVGLGMALACLLIVFGQCWLDNSDFATPLQPGLFLPAGASIWLLSIAYARHQWDSLLTR